MNRFKYNDGFEKPKAPMSQDEMIVVGTKLKITNEGINHNVNNRSWSRLPEILVISSQKTSKICRVLDVVNGNHIEMEVATIWKYYEAT